MPKVRGKPWHSLAEDQKWLCFYCKRHMIKDRGRPLSATVDHRVPQCKYRQLLVNHIQQTGTCHLEWPEWQFLVGNKVAACSECNNRKGDMPEAEFRKLLGKVKP